jgi:putative CocE/NonD family hydrolase
LAQDTLNRRVQDHTDARAAIWTVPLALYPLFDLPHVAEELGSTASLAPYFLDWLAHPNYDDYWKAIAIDEHFSEVAVPALHVAAWYDIFLGGSIRNYMGIKAHGASEEARRGQRLLIVIGGHAGEGRKIGDFDFGAPAEYDEDGLILDWYDHLFKNAENQFSTPKPVKIFVMGQNQWREEDDWPLARARITKYFLHSSGKSNSLAGNGSLSTQAAEKEPADQYAYDPRNPVPTVGGPLCCDAQHWPAGPRDQRAVEQRPDVLVYSTAPLEQDVEVTGPIELELYASSSAVDTDFTAKLVDVWPDGRAQNLTEGILRARYRDSREQPRLMNPGEVYRLMIDLWATSNIFERGHRLRLEVTSSNFPRFDRNPNSGAAPYLRSDFEALEESFRTAVNVIYHDREHPSALLLPIVGNR